MKKPSISIREAFHAWFQHRRDCRNPQRCSTSIAACKRGRVLCETWRRVAGFS